MNIAIFLGTPFSQNTSGRRLLECLSFQVALKHKNTENPPMFPFDLPENPKIIKENGHGFVINFKRKNPDNKQKTMA